MNCGRSGEVHLQRHEIRNREIFRRDAARRPDNRRTSR
jgi:hypothetical protein